MSSPVLINALKMYETLKKRLKLFISFVDPTSLRLQLVDHVLRQHGQQTISQTTRMLQMGPIDSPLTSITMLR